MNKKFILICLLLAGMTITFVGPVYAGGWATITLDQLPENVSAGQTTEIGFMVRQHGMTPMADLTPVVVATQAGTVETFSVNAQPAGQAGHYVAGLIFPRAGTWNWSIRAFTMEQPMPPLVVSSPPAGVEVSRFNCSPQIWILGLGVVSAAAAALFLLGKRPRGLAFLLVAVLLLTGVGFALAANRSPEATSAAAPALSPVERGEALFLAKGCITCHHQASVASKYEVVSGVSGPAGSAPDLSNYSANPDFLRSWLADPEAVKANTTMPDLALSADEIEALIAFLLKDPSLTARNTGPGLPPEDCPVTQPQKGGFTPPAPYPTETPTEVGFWYGTDDLWTLLPDDGTWWGLPYHDHQGKNGHYTQKVVWWNKDYDWQSEPQPGFTLHALRLDGPAPTVETRQATNAYHPDFGSTILTGVEIPTLGCWQFTGSYQGHSTRFVVRVVP